MLRSEIVWPRKDGVLSHYWRSLGTHRAVSQEQLLSPEQERYIRRQFITDYFATYVHPEKACDLTTEATKLRQLFPQIRTCIAEKEKAKHNQAATKIIEATTLEDIHDFAVERRMQQWHRLRTELAKVGGSEFNKEDLTEGLYEVWRWEINRWVAEKALELEQQKPR